MYNKPRKIINIEYDGEQLHVDLRVSIPKKQMTSEFIWDILVNKDKIIEGEVVVGNPAIYVETRLEVENIDGKDILKFHKGAFPFE